VEIVLKVEQCPRKEANVTKIKKAVYKVDKAAKETH
jgi:hypothetical protein